MTMATGSVRLEVRDASQVAEARRAVNTMATSAGFDETDAGRASVVASEMATNLAKHAGGGALLARPLVDGIEVVAVDRGPGMADPMQCQRDGYSTAGSAGNGLGAIKRMSDAFDLYSQVGAGTVVLGRLRNRQRPPTAAARIRLGAVSLPMDGSLVCGDIWAAQADGGIVRVLLFDGLGHGPQAAVAAQAALHVAWEHPHERPEALMRRVHNGIRHTRGAVGVVCDVAVSAGSLRIAGVGNIAVVVVQNGAQHQLVSHNGTLGHHAARFQEFSHPWERGTLLIACSDGLTSRWDLARYPGLMTRDPALIAAVLWRDFQRGRDDVTVLVIQEP